MVTFTHTEEVHLDVPFSQKDQVKSVRTARFNGSIKKWVVPAGQDLKPYEKWLPAKIKALMNNGVDPTEEKYGRSPDNNEQMTVASFISGVSDAIMKRYNSDIWLIGQISSVRERKSVTLIELMDNDQVGATTAAKIDITAFNDTFKSLQTKLEKAAGQGFTEGMNVRIKIRPTFNGKYHLGARLLDIDPTVTVGAFEVELRRIREKLKAEGIFAKNKEMEAPADYCRVAVIHPFGASGMHDFQVDARKLEENKLCLMTYHSATFEGENAEKSILDAFKSISAAHAKNPIDAIAVIRGGGSKQSLISLSTEMLARAICQAPVPVITGIGHADDDTLLDEVSWMRCDTPSKVIAHIRDHIHNKLRTQTLQFEQFRKEVISEITRRKTQNIHAIEMIKTSSLGIITKMKQRNHERFQSIRNVIANQLKNIQSQKHEAHTKISFIRSQVGSIISKRKAESEKKAALISSGAKQHLTKHRTRIEKQIDLIRSESHRLIKQARQSNLDKINFISGSYNSVLLRIRRDFEQKFEMIQAMSPQATLNRGYAIALDTEGKVLSSVADATKQDQFSVRFKDGNLDVKPV